MDTVSIHWTCISSGEFKDSGREFVSVTNRFGMPPSFQVEIANFELYSSSMRNFRVMISDRFPTRDWTLLGNLTAVDERSVQSFALQNNDQFGKFVKVSRYVV